MSDPWHLTPIGLGIYLFEPREGLDPRAAEAYLGPLIAVLRSGQARSLFYDVKEVAVIDDLYYGWLMRLYHACRLVSVDFQVAHIRPETAYALSSWLPSLPPFRCILEIDHGRVRPPESDVAPAMGRRQIAVVSTRR